MWHRFYPSVVSLGLLDSLLAASKREAKTGLVVSVNLHVLQQPFRLQIVVALNLLIVQEFLLLARVPDNLEAVTIQRILVFIAADVGDFDFHAYRRPQSFLLVERFAVKNHKGKLMFRWLFRWRAAECTLPVAKHKSLYTQRRKGQVEFHLRDLCSNLKPCGRCGEPALLLEPRAGQQHCGEQNELGRQHLQQPWLSR